jgi:hypothetical protein
VLVDLQSAGRNCAINQQKANGFPSSVGVGHWVKKLHALITLLEPQDPIFLPPTHFLHESGSL